MAGHYTFWLAMDFDKRLTTFRKDRGLTQAQLAEKVGIHPVQIRRYETGTAQPTLDVLRKLAIALSVSTDMLVFDKDERGPDDELRLQFEALRAFTPEEKMIAKAVLESLILKHDAQRFHRAS